MSHADDPGEMSAVELGKLFRQKKLSPVEAAKASLGRIARFNEHVNAFCHVDEQGALAAARGAEQRFMKNSPLSPIDGVPSSIKDLTLAAGMPTHKGSLTVDPNANPGVDAPFTQRMREAGAVLLGKTATPEFGWKGVTDNPVSGITRNPWNTGRTSGGSSGGAAVAAALNMGALHQGSDAGGSIRIPAGFCGVFGMKPSFGFIPQWPASAMTTLSHMGAISRSVADAALMLNVTARPDSRDSYQGWGFPADWTSDLEKPLAGLKAAYSPTLGYVQVHPEVRQAVDRAVALLETLGAVVEQTDPGFADPVDSFNTLWFAGAAKILAGVTDEMKKRMDPGLVAIGEQGQSISAVAYLKATEARSVLAETMARFHQHYDVLLTPALPITAFEAGRNNPVGDPNGNWVSWTPFTYPFNMTQQPASSVPCGFDAQGLPVGISVVAAKYDDLTAMRVSYALERALKPVFPSEPVNRA
jgi:Asp-tRNAAsn/Glu-tRNAGln amidotransferase A subunit and related amidases